MFDTVIAFLKAHLDLLIIFVLGFTFSWFFLPHRKPSDFYVVSPLPADANHRLFAYSRHYPVVWVLAFLRVLIFTGWVVGIVTMRGLSGLTVFALLFFGYIVFLYISHLFHFIAMQHISARLNNQSTHWSTVLKNSWGVQWLLIQLTAIEFLTPFLTTRRRGDRYELSTPRIQWLNKNLYLAFEGLGLGPATYFLMPVFLEKPASLTEAIGKSARTIKNKFGHVIGLNFSFPKFTDIIGICIIIVGFISLLVVMSISPKGRGLTALQKFTYIKPLMISFGAICIGICILVTVSTVMEWIFTCIAYNYTQGKNTGPFSSDFIRETIVTKQE